MTKHIEMIIDYTVNDEDFQYNDNHGVLTRCKDCTNWRKESDHTCRYYGDASPRLASDYCSRAVRKDADIA